MGDSLSNLQATCQFQITIPKHAGIADDWLISFDGKAEYTVAVYPTPGLLELKIFFYRAL